MLDVIDRKGILKADMMGGWRAGMMDERKEERKQGKKGGRLSVMGISRL